MSEQNVPKLEDVLNFYSEQVSVNELRTKLAILLMQAAEANLNRAKFEKELAELGPQIKPEIVQHKVTQEDLDANPELVEAGVAVGDVIGLTDKVE